MNEERIKNGELKTIKEEQCFMEYDIVEATHPCDLIAEVKNQIECGARRKPQGLCRYFARSSLGVSNGNRKIERRRTLYAADNGRGFSPKSYGDVFIP